MSSDREDLTDKSASKPKIFFTTSYNLGGIGVFVDRWANLFPAMGEKIADVQANILSELKTREVPTTFLGAYKASTGAMSQLISKVMGGWERPYIIAETDPGVVCAVYIGKYGTDLYASWRTHVRGVINWKLIGIAIAIAILPTLCSAALLSTIFPSVTATTSVFGTPQPAPNNPFIGLYIGLLVGVLVLEAILIGGLGYFLRGDFLAYLFIEPNIFNAEDVTALSAAVHQSILTAIDKAGIPTKDIEPKKFQSGRRSDRI